MNSLKNNQNFFYYCQKKKQISSEKNIIQLLNEELAWKVWDKSNRNDWKNLWHEVRNPNEQKDRKVEIHRNEEINENL